MKEFTTTAVDTDDQPVEFSIDGHPLTAYKPTDGQIAMVMTALAGRNAHSTKVAGVIDFFVSVLGEDSADWVTDRLLSRTDPMPLSQIETVLEWLLDEWGYTTPTKE